MTERVEMSPPDFLSRASRHIARLVALACPGVARPGLLVALSGGPDSVALLLAAHHWARQTGNPLEAAHLDHLLRGTDSAGDADFCAGLCARLDVPLHLRREDPRPAAGRRGQGLEEAGRHLRLAFFDELLGAGGHLHCLAKGHHRDDQAETVVMRLFRGTGPEGLAGIRPAHGRTIHPLLDFTRGDLLAFLEGAGQPWRTDATNLTGDSTRSRVRRELLPLARDIFGQGCDRSAARLADLLAADQFYLEEQARLAAAPLRAGDTAGGALRVPGLLALPAALATRVLRSWLTGECAADRSRLEFAHIMNILDWLRVGQSGTGLDLPGGLRLVRRFDLLRVDSGAPAGPAAADCRVLVKPCPPLNDPTAAGQGEGAGRRGPDGTWNLSCPAGVLEGNLRVRHPRPGDRFQPFGLDGTRKLSDLFREKKIPEDERTHVLVVEDGAGILWIVGVERGERTRLLPTSGRMVTICVARR